MILHNEVKTDFRSPSPHRFSSFLLFSSIFFIALGVSPYGWLSDEIVKNSMFLIGGVFIFFVVFIEQLQKGVFYFYKTPLLKAIFLCAISSFLSALLSSNIAGSLGDLTPGLGSPSGGVVLFLLMYSVLSIFSNTRRVIGFYISTAIALVILVFLQSIDLFLFPLVGVSQETFAGQMLNLPIILGFTVLFFVLVLDFFPLGFFVRLPLYLALGGSFVLLVAIPFPVVWEVLAGFLVLSASFFFSTFHRMHSQVSTQGQSTPLFPWHSIIFSTLAFSLIFVGPTTSSLFEDVRNHKGIVAEVRPSFSSGVSVLGGLYESSIKSLLLGVGNSLFSSVWNLYKPPQINNTPLWNVDFEVSNSSFLTIAATGGILGVCTILVFHGVLIFEMFRFFFFRKLSLEAIGAYYLTGISFLLGGFVFVWSFFYFPGALLLLLGVGSIAAGVALLPIRAPLRWNVGVMLKLSPSASRMIFGGGVLLCSVLFLGFFLMRIVSVIYYQKAKETFLARGDFQQAEIFIKKALVFSTSDTYHRTFSEIKQFEANQLIESGQKTEEIRKVVVEGNNAAQRAVEVDVANYLNWIVLGNGQYQHLLLFDPKAHSPLEFSYNNALKLSPLNPIPYYLKGRFLITIGKINEARILLQQALLLKPDYKPAELLLKEIEG